MISPELMSPEGSQTSSTSRRSNFGTPTARKQALRSVLDKTQSLQNHANSNATLGILENVFQEADQIHDDISMEEKISNQDEVVMDSEVMSVSSKVIKSCTQVLTKEYNTFSSMEFAHKLMEYVQQLPDTTVADVNWSMLQKDVPAFKATATYVNLLNKIMRVGERRNKRDKNGSGDKSLNDSGSNDEGRPKGSVKTENILSSQRRNAYVEQVAARMNRTRLNDPNVTTKRPDNVIQVEVDADNDGNKPILDHLRKLIRKVYKDNGKQPIDYFKLILDPGDFGKTIENMLHVAFLAKDGFIRFRTGNFSHDYYYLSIIISTVSGGNCIDFNLVNNY
ncbi:EP300-interacting inhibitor of differentiation 3 isoform X2 [Cotesia glomerata]|uniref:EP300-interacting inhibitor of differentiation 3 isoform X2 n=1 Tax=Cotesia glomerata TaxID=32391 RepID=UPI001D0121E4|nr:EP300-interacting inhibitor of differentiation 3 isoform X2 [Cotesia glomerata]